MMMKPMLFIEVLVFAVATAACGSSPTDEAPTAAEVIVEGAITTAEGAPVSGVVVRVYGDSLLGAACTGVYSVFSGSDTTDPLGAYSLLSLNPVDDTVCVGIRVTPPDSTGLAQRFVQEILLPYRYPKLDALDTVRVDAVLEPR